MTLAIAQSAVVTLVHQKVALVSPVIVKSVNVVVKAVALVVLSK